MKNQIFSIVIILCTIFTPDIQAKDFTSENSDGVGLFHKTKTHNNEVRQSDDDSYYDIGNKAGAKIKWEESSNKNASSFSDGETVTLTSKNLGTAVAVADLPINPNYDFSITFNFYIPKITKGNFYGVQFNGAFGVLVGKNKLFITDGGNTIEKKWKFFNTKEFYSRIKFVKHGKSVTIYIDNEAVYEISLNRLYPVCSLQYVSWGKSSVLLKSVIIEQENYEEETSSEED